jgi:Ca2+-binding RTX toxin-like protein
MSGITVSSDTYFLQFNVDFSLLYLANSFVRSATLFRATFGTGEYEELRGEGFTYDADGKLISGTVTSYATYQADGKQLVLIEGRPVDATLIADAAETYELDDDALVLKEVLKGDDTLTGGKYSDVLAGFDGNDILKGRAGNDSLYGYDGNDTIIGGEGIDWLYGGEGSDIASYVYAAAGVTASLAAPASNTNEAKGDRYFSIENLTGSRFSDVLTGDSSGNTLWGLDGNDTLIGGAGNDKLFGGAGADQLLGGVGADRFVFKSTAESAGSMFDTILDFLPGEGDKIDLSAIDAIADVAGNQAFTLVKTSFTGTAGELRYYKGASETYIYGDVNGDMITDIKIRLDGAVTLTKDYFIL